MGTEKRIAIHLVEHASWADLVPEDAALVGHAAQAAGRAYAPYSNFHVGAALRLNDGTVVEGNNQENASFPAGICAERTALHAALSMRPSAVVRTIAIVVPSTDRPVTPCGICRQALLEQEHRQGAPIRVLMAVPDGVVWELATASDLLPFSFDPTFLTR